MGFDEDFLKLSDRITLCLPSIEVEFWRAQYAMRRVYIENKGDYPEILKSMDLLKTIAKIMYSSNDYDFFFPEARDFELLILNKVSENIKIIEMIDLNSIKELEDETKCTEIEIQKYLQKACELSIHYGYVLSDLKLIMSGKKCSKLDLLDLVETLEENFWKDIHKKGELEIQDDVLNSVCYCFETPLIPRFFGPNASPWHNVKEFKSNIIKSTTKLIINDIKPEIQSDITFCVSNLHKEDFVLKPTLAKIEELLIIEQLKILQQKDNDISSKIIMFLNELGIKKPEGNEEKTRLIFLFLTKEDFLRSKIKTSDDDVKRKRLHKESDKIGSEIKKKIRRLKKLENDLKKAPIRGSIGNIPRAIALFLWDTVNIDGKTPDQAIEIFNMSLSERRFGFHYIDSDDDSRKKCKSRIKLIDKCIMSGLFLPMT